MVYEETERLFGHPSKVVNSLVLDNFFNGQ